MTVTALLAAISGCGTQNVQEENDDFKYLVDEFADLQIMRYQSPGWDELSLQQKEYVYHLSEAAKWGRDIIWDQNCKCNLQVRHALEQILLKKGTQPTGDRDWDGFLIYAKRVFFSNGIHHHYAENKFFPECPKEYFASLMQEAGVYSDDLLDTIYNPSVFPEHD